MLFHSRGSIACLRIAVTTQIGENKPKVLQEGFARGKPELVRDRKRVKKNDRRSLTDDFVSDLRVAAANCLQGRNRIMLGRVRSSAAQPAAAIEAVPRV